MITPREIEDIEEGVDGASFYALYCSASKETRATAFLLNWMLLMPKFLVRFLVQSGWCRRISLPGPYLNLVIPRAILALANSHDVRGRHHLRRYVVRKLRNLRDGFSRLVRLPAFLKR